MPEFRHTSEMPVSADDLFDWHARPGAFQRLAPPWEKLEVLHAEGGIRDGAVLEFAMKKGPLRIRWRARHAGYVEGRQFQDIQERGPFAQWVHTHRFEPLDVARSRLDDHIAYRLPLGPIGALFGGGATRRMLARMFAFRHLRTEQDVTRHQQFADRGPQRVVISGASGLVGTALSSFLTTGGHAVRPLVRHQPAPNSSEIAWNPREGTIDAAALEGVDVVIHLAGEGIADGRWTDEKKRRIRESRVQGTTLLCNALARLERKPRVLVSASAIGFYGNRGDEVLDEQSAPGSDFLADVAREWEASTQPAVDAGIRVVNARIGVVLSPQGGALEKMLPPFRAGVGGVVAGGQQYLSWIGLDDLIGALQFAMFTEALRGPVNLVAPTPVTNRELTKTLGRVLGRPTFFPIPAAMVKLLFGEMGEATLLASTRVVPTSLEAAGFTFQHPTLEGALRFELGLG